MWALLLPDWPENLGNMFATDSHGLLSNFVNSAPTALFEKAIPISLPKLSRTASSETWLYLWGNTLACQGFVEADKKAFMTQSNSGSQRVGIGSGPLGSTPHELCEVGHVTTTQTVVAAQGRDRELQEPEPSIMDDMLALCSTNRHCLWLLSLFALLIYLKRKSTTKAGRACAWKTF